MACEQVGYRRLYDSLGCLLAGQEELDVLIPMGALQVRVYMGPKPKLGITVGSSDKYIVPGAKSIMLDAEYKKDATQSSYPHHFFTEIICLKQVEVSQELSDAFRTKDQRAHSELLRLAQQDAQHLKATTDLVAGIVGLRLHRQFVLEVINENFLAMRNEDDYAFDHAGPGLEVLEEVKLTQPGTEILRRLLLAVGKANPKDQEFGSSALVWLLHAWTERDSISKFMALFVPIEIILSGYGGDPDNEKDKQRRSVQILKILCLHGGPEAQGLIDFFANQMMGQQRPSLASRFEEMAKESRIDGWETDVAAFRRFNSIRNGLLHRGNRQVQLLVSLGEELQQETCGLEDIVERYISWTLFRDGVVYPSRWRPKRNVQQKREPTNEAV